MFAVWLRLGIIVTVLLAAGCQQRPLAFVSKGDKFQAQFGGKPKVVEKTVGGLRSVVYSVVTTDGARTVAVTELPLKGDEPAELIPRYLDSAKGDMIRAAGGKAVSETNITLVGKYPGRDFSVRVTEPKPGVLRARIYLVGTRLYQVTVLGTDSYAASDESTAFLDSFQLTE